MPQGNHDVIQNGNNNAVQGDVIDKKSIWQTSTDDQDTATNEDRPFKNDTNHTKDADLNIDLDESQSNSDEDENDNNCDGMDVIDEVNRAVQNIDSRIDLDDSDVEELNTDIDTDNGETTGGSDGDGDDGDDDDDSILRQRKFQVDSDSDDSGSNDMDSNEDTERDVDPIDILLQRAKARRMGKNLKFKQSRPVFEEDIEASTVLSEFTDETTDRTGSIIDNLESVFEK